MIICPSCQQTELVGSLFCSNCGSLLNHLDSSPVSMENHKSDCRHPNIDDQYAEGGFSRPALEKESEATLQILSTGDLIPLQMPGEYTLGRVSGNQPILPDIDLTMFQAYEAGVSRLHATIQIHKDNVTITDLGSANGTRVNNIRITAHDPHPIKNSDVFSLGIFKIRILIRDI